MLQLEKSEHTQRGLGGDFRSLTHESEVYLERVGCPELGSCLHVKQNTAKPAAQYSAGELWNNRSWWCQPMAN